MQLCITVKYEQSLMIWRMSHLGLLPMETHTVYPCILLLTQYHSEEVRATHDESLEVLTGPMANPLKSSNFHLIPFIVYHSNPIIMLLGHDCMKVSNASHMHTTWLHDGNLRN